MRFTHGHEKHIQLKQITQRRQIIVSHNPFFKRLELSQNLMAMLTKGIQTATLKRGVLTPHLLYFDRSVIDRSLIHHFVLLIVLIVVATFLPSRTLHMIRLDRTTTSI